MSEDISNVPSDEGEADGLPIGSAFTVPDYSLSEEDQPYVDRVLAVDPVRDVPSSVKLKGRITIPAKLTINALPPGPLREKVEKQLAAVPISQVADAQHEFVRKALEENSLSFRSKGGVGSEALPYWQEMASISSEGHRLMAEFDRNAAELGRVSHHETRFDAETGKNEPFPVLAVQGNRREAMLNRQGEIIYHLKLLEGIEGKRRLDKAMAETVTLLRTREAQAVDEREIAKRVEEGEREARISARVNAKLRIRSVEVKD